MRIRRGSPGQRPAEQAIQALVDLHALQGTEDRQAEQAGSPHAADDGDQERDHLLDGRVIGVRFGLVRFDLGLDRIQGLDEIEHGFDNALDDDRQRQDRGEGVEVYPLSPLFDKNYL